MEEQLSGAVNITAAFSTTAAAHEAERKLQALRAQDVACTDDGSLTATVPGNVADRAFQMIRQIGGTPE